MKDIVFLKNDKIYLNSNLTEEMFAKTKFSNLLKEKGLLISKSIDGKFNKIEEWTFELPEFFEDSVHFTKKTENFKTLDSIINEEKNVNFAILDVVSAISYAQKNNFSVPVNCPLGILLNEEKVLFLPEKTFDFCAKNLGLEEYNKLQNIWRDSVSSGKIAENFLKSVLVYYSFTKKVPFPIDEKAEQSVNIADKNFLPLEFCINGLNKKLCNYVDKSLKSEDVKEEFPLEEFKNDLIFPEKRKKTMKDEEFNKTVENFKIVQKTKISSKRKIRKHYVTMIISAVVFVFLCICGIYIHYENGKKPSVVGLDSKTVTKIFYSGLHTMNADYMTESAKECPQAVYYISTLPQIRVVSLMPGAYNFQSGLSTPENWFFFEPDTTKAYSHQIYGITNFTIDGENSILYEKIPTKSQKKAKLTRQDGKRIRNFDEKIHKVKYFLVHTVNNQIQVETYETDVILLFKKDKWQISELKQNFVTEFYDWAVFSADYKRILSENNGNIEISTQKLKQKYEWVPTLESIIHEKEYLDSLGY